ncbi:hypothetical protein CC79DRAFT_1398765 [Sarocladium strictum]
MYLPTITWGALLLVGIAGTVCGETECPSDLEVVEIQPYEIICDGKTLVSTATRTFTVPFVGGDVPSGQPDRPGQSIKTTTTTATCTDACAPATIPPPPGCTLCTETVIRPPPTLPPGTSSITITSTCTDACTPTTIPPPPGCTLCTETVVRPPPTPTPGTPPPADNTITILETCSTAASCPPETNTEQCRTTRPCTTSITVFETPPASPSGSPSSSGNPSSSGSPSSSGTPPPADNTITILETCSTAASCPPETNTEQCRTTRPCTTSITVFETPPPDVTSTITGGVCTTASSCDPMTNTQQCLTTRPCTTFITEHPPPEGTPTPTSTPESTPSSIPETTPSSTPESTPSSTPESTPSSTPETTPTSTPETTPTSTPEPTPTSSTCSTPTCPTGISRAQYPQPFGGAGGFNNRFNTTYFKETTPDSQDIVSTFSDIGDAAGNERSYEYATFVYSCEGGRFDFQITNADDIALAWFGGLACGDFEKLNNQTYASYEEGPGDVTFTANLEPETYFPIRLIFVNSGGPASLDISVTGPDGSIGDDENGYGFFPDTCDDSNSFVPFGSEAEEGRSCTNP